MANWRTLRIGVTMLTLLLFASPLARADILSSKRGFGDTGANYNNLQATGAGWYYTWGTGTANPGSFDAKHIPMFWNAPSQSTINTVKARNTEWVLGFNEPERSDQANMTVAQAISSWTTISNSFTGTNTKLISPAVADTGGATGGQQWLASFMQQATANSLKVDAVAFHWYGVSNPNDPAGAASSFLSRVDSYHNSYGLPVFITEFAIHDWGGAYTDAQIIEANRIFLDIVIPGLESRSYVAGYSWYHWFSDAHLYDSSPSKPTPMAYSYVGAVESGQVANIGGQNLGEHVAYLTGGELTMTGGTAGSIRYINALANASSISGSMNWGLAAGSNWVRIQPGATLRKASTNQITFGGTITNNGVVEVADGTLKLGGNMGGTGAIDVRAGATLDVSSLSSLSVFSGSIISGGGTIAGSLTAQSGSTVRVGKDGAGVPSRFVIDNFESYTVGDVRTTASPPWIAHQDTSLADIEDYGGYKVLTFGWASDFRGVSRTLPESAALANNQTATYFFRINSKTSDPDHSFGLGDQASTGAVAFADYEAQLRLKQGTGSTFDIDARNGSGFTATLASGLALNTWYNIWMVVNQTTDKYDIYMNTGAGAATSANKLNSTPLSFRNGTTSDLNTILGLAGSAPIDNGVRFDDIAFFSGVDLTNPLAGFDPGLVWTAETLTVTGNYTQSAGSTLQLNIRDPSHHDVLNITGHATIAGTLNVSFAVGAPIPQVGDEFNILDFASLSGIFDSVVLPALSAGLVWDNSLLLSDGILKIAAGVPGDYNDDGQVDAADYLIWRKSQGQVGAGLAADGNGDLRINATDFAVWRANFGNSLSGSAAGKSAANAVPEPTFAVIFIFGLPALCIRLRGRRLGKSGE